MTDTPEFNSTLAQIGLDRVRFEDNGEHDQSTWGTIPVKVAKEATPFRGRRAVPLSCGTTGCFAGHVVAALGYAMLVDTNYRLDSLNDEGSLYVADCVQVDEQGHPIGPRQSIPRLARRKLGLTEYEADALFDGTNTIDEIEKIVKTIDNGTRLHSPKDDFRMKWIEDANGGFYSRCSTETEAQR